MKDFVELDVSTQCVRELWGACRLREEGKCPLNNLIGNTKRLRMKVKKFDEKYVDSVLTAQNFAMGQARQWVDIQKPIKTCDEWHKIDLSFKKDFLYWTDPQFVGPNGTSFWKD